MGTTQLLSVPYALFAEQAGNAQIYTAGNGIQITGNVITNTMPDLPITITGQGATTVTGTYPNFTISSTDNNTTYTAGTGLNLTGTTFSHVPHTGDVSGTTSLTVTGIQGITVSSTAPTTNQVLKYNGTQWTPTQPSSIITAGNGLSYSGNTINSVWTISGNNIYNNNTGRVGIGINSPTGKLTVQGDTSNILFEVKDKNGIPVFVIYQDSVNVFVNNTGANSGSFNVNPKSTNKAAGNYILRVTPDSTRIWTEDTIKGFGIRNRNAGQVNSYMQLTPNNYFIGHEAGKSILSIGLYNSFFGYMSGRSTNSGDNNVFMGYKSGYSNTSGSNSVFIGFNSGYYNTTGFDNIFIGLNSGYSNTSGYNNILIGENSGYSNTAGINNCFIGESSGHFNSIGSYNTFIGFRTGYNNIEGLYNVFLGYMTGYNGNTGDHNILIGTRTGYNLQNSNYNVMIGNYSGFNTNNADYNTFLGYYSGYFNLSGEKNVFLGYYSGYKSSTASNNTFIGTESGYNNTGGQKNIFLGYRTGYLNQNGEQNIFIGDQAGFSNISGNRIICIGDSAGSKNTASNNIFIGSQAGRNNTTGDNNLFIGIASGSGNTTGFGNTYIGWGTANQNNGSNNVMIGYWAGLLSTNSNRNIFIGQAAGFANTGNDNIFLGYVTGNNNFSDNIFIGNELQFDDNNTLLIDGTGDETTPLIFGNFLTNRVGFHRNSTNYPFQVGTTTSNGNGAYLSAGGTWTNASSKSLKDRFEEINKNDLLSKIEQLDVKVWYYKETNERHIGPFAEDFYQAFGTGVLDEPTYLGKSLAASDVAGVSLAAVKELIIRNKQQSELIEQLLKRIEQLEKKINNSSPVPAQNSTN